MNSVDTLLQCGKLDCLCMYVGETRTVLKVTGAPVKKPGIIEIHVSRANQLLTTNNDGNGDKDAKQLLNYHDFRVVASWTSDRPNCPLFSRYKDETFAKVFFEKEAGLSELMTNFLSPGVLVDYDGTEKEYQFFGCSSSQMRERICLLYNAKLGKWKDIVLSFGHFDAIKTVAKFSARTGLLLSSTLNFESNVMLEDGQISRIEDIERNGYNFTDGCGFIAPDLASKVTAALELLSKSKRTPIFSKLLYKNHKYQVPSVFQIRLMGCKGVVALNPYIKRNTLEIRPSMEKFRWKPDPPYRLGISDNGFSIPYDFGKLNKQYIMVLSALGIRDSVFLELQRNYYQELQKLDSDPYLALKFLCLENKRWDLIERLSQKRPIDQETRSVLRTIRSSYIETSNKKDSSDLDRLKIPIWKSRNIFGICDQTGKLQQGEVFVQVTVDGSPKFLEDGRSVIVTRSPCHSPGDIRLLKCRAIPELQHLVDCIVFPTNGDRPHADEMSGGDLDGDKFFVCWDERLIPLEQKDPIDYRSASTVKSVDSVEQSDLLLEFVKYNASLLGKITNLFMKWADAEPVGVNSDICKVLRMKCSRAVDAAKTGEAVTLEKAFFSVPTANRNHVWIKMAEIAECYAASNWKMLLWKISRL